MFWTFRRYLLAVMALYLLSVFAGTWYGWLLAKHDAITAASEDTRYGARLAAERLATAIGVIHDAVRELAANPRIGELRAGTGDCQLAFSLGGPDDGHLDVLAADGIVRCSSRTTPAPLPPDGYPAAPWLPTAVRSATVVAPVLDTRTGRPALIVSEPVPGLGVVAAFVDTAALAADLAKEFGGTRNLAFTVQNADGTTVFGESTGRGSSRIYATVPIAGHGWRLIASTDRAKAYAPARRLITRQAIVLTSGLSVVLLTLVVVYRRVAHPVARLRVAVRAAPNLPEPLPLSGPREVAELGADFNRLVTTVRSELDERRRAEETARQLFARNPFPMLVFDVETLAVVDANDAATAYYGHPLRRLQELTATDLCPAEDAATVTAVLSATGTVERRGPVRQLRQDGTLSEVIITAHPLADDGRRLRCALIEDVSERENMERRLRQSQRLESLGQLAGGVAHDFNNLLGIILGYAEMAAADLAPVAQDDPAWRPLHDDLVQIVQAGDRATGLTRQLLAFARAEVTQPRVLDLNEVVRDIERLLRRTLGEDVELRVDLPSSKLCVHADPGQLEQVLVNLSVNARDAMPTGGTLLIATDTVDADEHYAAQHPGLARGRYARLRISDTGTGMTQATLDRAFEPFFTTKPKGQGTGLGLATIYGIVTQAGGDVQIYSEVGLGTTFTVLLPASEVPATPPAGPSDLPRPGRGETILLAEDEDGLRGLTERVLARENYTVLVAASVAEAIRLATPGQRVDLLLTDVVMPEVDGHELATRLRLHRPELPVIYMSGYTETVLATRSTLPPGSTLLTKPVTAHQLLAAIRRALDARASSDNYSERR
jgi:PAS domain S-box-containing protein